MQKRRLGTGAHVLGFAEEMLRAGDRLGERYQIIEQIAAGGMGTLWRARHLELDVDVALKVVSTRAATPGSLRRFKREARAAARLRSPHIVQMLDFGEFEGQPYLAMELLKGEDLAARLDRVGKISFDGCVRIIDGVAKAVQLAHRANIVHRDIKPANIFLENVGDEEVVKILDFGVAKDLAAVAEPGSTTGVGVVGSPAYMSPEQVWGQPVGPASDVWSMAVVGFEMLTGRNPFFADTLAEIFERIIREPLPKPSQFASGLPPEVDLFFERALARSAKDRIGSAREFADTFRAASEGRELPLPRLDDEQSVTLQASSGAEVAVTTRRPRAERAHGLGRRSLTLGVGLAIVLACGAALVALPNWSGDGEVKSAGGERATARPMSVRLEAAPPQASAVGAASAATAQLVIGSAPASHETSPSPSQSSPSKRLPARRPKQNPSQGSPTAPPSGFDPKFGIPLGQ